MTKRARYLTFWHDDETGEGSRVTTKKDKELPLERDVMDPNQTIRQLATTLDDQQPPCITYLTMEAPFELKSSLIHLFPTFMA